MHMPRLRHLLVLLLCVQHLSLPCTAVHRLGVKLHGHWYPDSSAPCCTGVNLHAVNNCHVYAVCWQHLSLPCTALQCLGQNCRSTTAPILLHNMPSTRAEMCAICFFAIQDLSLSVYSFAVLGVKLPEAWWGAFWVASGRCMEAASSQALANMFWAHARLRKVGLGLLCGAFGVSGFTRSGSHAC
jgi:hypothetical protein